MAKSATASSVAESKREPQFLEACRLIRGEIKQKKDRISGINGEIKERWDKIEGGYKVDKIGAKIWASLDKLEPDERAVAYRTLTGMIEACDWPEMQSDLVDEAEGKVLDPRKAAKREAVGDEIEAAGDDATDEAEVEDEGPAKPATRGRRVTPGEAKERAKLHLQSVK